MKQRCSALVILFYLITLNINAQNFLPPVFKISFTDTSEAIKNEYDISGWETVNLLLSWERQGYFWLNGKCCLANDFFIPADFSNSDLTLTLSLVCNVEKIFVNGNYIGGSLPNKFWSNRGLKTEFALPVEYINFGGNNRIAILANELSYTGGRSHNLCIIAPKNTAINNSVGIIVPRDEHLFSLNDGTKELKLKYSSERKGSIQFSVVNDFHESFIEKKFDIGKGEGEIAINFEKEITKPGFYECTAILDDGSYAGDVQWFTLSPEKIECVNKTSPRFKQYWDVALSELAGIKPELKMIKVDSLCSENRDGYIVEMKSLGGLTIRGYYFVPKTAGKHAAVLHVPGYGYGFQHHNIFLQNKDDVAEFALCVRAHGISADVFNPGFGVPGVWGHKLCSELENAYRGIYMDCVRAVEFLLSRPEIDADRIGVMGGSQGGGLTLATAGLCAGKIKACAFFDPFPCDTRDQLKIRTMCSAEIDNFLKFYNNECSFEDALNVQDLIDSKGFASWITCPAFFVTALFDDDCPPHGGFAAYNEIKTEKQFKIYPYDSHLGESNIYKALYDFLKERLAF